MAQPIAKARSRGRRRGPARRARQEALNLLQGSFPLDPRPFARVAGLAGLPEDEVLRRTARLLDERIIREITPIFDTRVLGYSSMLGWPRSTPRTRGARPRSSTHPGVSHNYLRDHDFNLWFTIATEPDSPLGLDGTLDVLQRLTGAESVRQLPTLRLFKIRMDLEMEKGTEALAAAAEAIEHREPEAIPLSDDDACVIRADPGADGGRARALCAGRREPGVAQEELAARVEAMRGARCGAWRRSCSTAAPASRRTAWASGTCPRSGSSSSARGCPPSAASRTATSAPPTTTGPTRSSRWPTAARRGVRRDPGLDRRRHRDRRPADALLVDRVQEDPAALLHRRAQAVGSRALLTSLELYARALDVLPGGVNSPVRAMRSIGRDPIFVARGEGAS